MRLIKAIFFAFSLAFLVCGCSSTSRRDAVLARLMQDINNTESAGQSLSGSDAPEAPVSPLPPIPVQEPPPPPKVEEAPVDSAQDITIQPDSQVQINVDEDPSLDGSYPVNEIGAVELGYIGPVFLFNRTAKEAASKIKEVLKTRGHFRNATVVVRIQRASYDNVAVTGVVNKPGRIRIGAGDSISLNDALLKAGGLRASAKSMKIRVVREGLLSAVAPSLPGEEYVMVDDSGKPSVPKVFLRNNDVVYVFSGSLEATVEAVEKEVVVLGEVQRPGIYRFSGSEPCTVMHLMFKMGGLPLYANKKAIKIIRRDKEGVETEIKVNAEMILEDGNPEHDVQLENGDRVVVPARRLSIF